MDAVPFPPEARTAVTSAIASDIYCVGCDYNLRALTADRCPECGRRLGALRSGVSEIPWVNRQGRGPLRAWLATVWWVTWHFRRLADEVLLSFDECAARRFHHLTTLLTWLPLMAAGIVAGVWWVPQRFPGDRDGQLVASVALATAMVGVLPVIHAMQTFIAAHYRTTPMSTARAACYHALARYAGAVRFWLILAVPLAAVALAIPPDKPWLKPLGPALAAAVPFPLMAWLEAILFVPAQRLAGKKSYRRAAFLSFSVGWPLLMLATLVLIPGIAAYVTSLTILLLR